MPEAGALWDEADVVVAIGSDLDGMMTQGWKQPQPPHLVAINVDPRDASKNYRPDVLIEADAARAAAALAERLGERGGLDSLERRVRELNRAVRDAARDEDPEALGSSTRSSRAARRRDRGLRHVHPRLLARRLPPHPGAAQARLPARLGHARLRVPAGARRGAGGRRARP